jgi:uncharacterized SAM-binding protein YcdF (DUF218 family)
MTDAFFALSKLTWVVLAPSNLLVLMIAAGLVLQIRTARLPTWPALWGRRLSVAGASGLIAVTALPVGDAALGALERRFAPLAACTGGAAPPYAGIIVLGGALSAIEIDGQPLDSMGEASDRLRLAAAIARARPDLPILASGGMTFASPGARTEAPMMRTLLAELGVAPERVIIEQASRTTAENARRAAALSPAGAEAPWILVTSAFHMPRAVGAFRSAGLAVVAAPTDWQVDPHAPWQTWNAADRLLRLNLAAKEYLGLLAYWLSGRLRSPAPAPQDPPACY